MWIKQRVLESLGERGCDPERGVADAAILPRAAVLVRLESHRRSWAQVAQLVPGNDVLAARPVNSPQDGRC